MYKNISVLVLFLMFPLIGLTEVYKWKGEDGQIHYSDVPPNGKVQAESLKTKSKPVVNPATATPNNQPAAGLVPSAKSVENAKKDVIEGETLESRQNRVKACDVAKGNLAKLKAGGSIYRENEKGERQYLDETTIKKEMEAAQKEVDVVCQAP